MLEKPATRILYEGNCLDMFKQTPDNSVHLIVTSPPYNLQMEYEQLLTKEEYFAFIEQVLRECYRVLVDSGRICWNVPNQLKIGKDGPIWSPSIETAALMQQIGFTFREFIIWNQKYADSKTAWGSWQSPSAPFIMHQTEAILVFHKGQWKLNRKGETDLEAKEFMKYTRSELWDIRPDTERDHPAAFPYEIPARLIKLFSYIGDVVLDPFAGSGTTLAMAERLKRQWIGAEKKTEYIPLAKKNIEREQYQTRFQT